MTKLKVLACQIDVPETPTARERDAHVERCASRIREHLESERADLVVLPELSTIDYSRQAFDRLDSLAETLDGPPFETYRALATRFGVTIVYGIARATGDGYAITQAAVGPDGTLLGHYDKLHIAQFGASMEKDYFMPGHQLLVLDVKEVRIAPIICYDIRFPELIRTLCVHHGVELVLHCGAYYRDESFPSWHAFVTTRAMENQCFVLSLNRAGRNFGSSVLCPPQVDENHPAELFDSHDEDIRTLALDTAAIGEAKRRLPFLADKLDDYRRLPCASRKANYPSG